MKLSKPLLWRHKLHLLLTLGLYQFGFSSDRTILHLEAEDASHLVSAKTIERVDASGGQVIRWLEEPKEAARADFEISVPAPGNWFLWIRTQAADHQNNGLYLEFDGVRQNAGQHHPMGSADTVYLRKDPSRYSWEPEWQGPGAGRHTGPIVVNFPDSHSHTISLVARSIERPFIDAISLTREARPLFLDEGNHLGPVPDAPLPGQLIIHPENPTTFGRVSDAGTIENFMLCGLGSPEGFLFLPVEEQDYIIDQLAQHGGNALYTMAVRTHGGDGTDQENPFIDHDPAKGLDDKILSQWSDTLHKAEKKGIYLVFFIYDDGAVPYGGKHENAVPPAEGDFVRELVTRLSIHPNIIWCIAEEYHDGLTTARAKSLAAIVAAHDPHGHPISVHQGTGDTSYDFHDDANINVFGFQPRSDSVKALHADVIAAVRSVNGKAIVHMTENWNNRFSDLAKKNDHAGAIAAGDRTGVRQRNWAVAMAGATCQVVGPWERTSGHKPATPEMLADMRSLNDFFSAVPLHKLESRDEKAFDDALWVLSNEQTNLFVAYALEGEGPLTVRLVHPGKFNATWLDGETGQTLETQETSKEGALKLYRPTGIGPECAVYVQPQP